MTDVKFVQSVNASAHKELVADAKVEQEIQTHHRFGGVVHSTIPEYTSHNLRIKVGEVAMF